MLSFCLRSGAPHFGISWAITKFKFVCVRGLFVVRERLRNRIGGVFRRILVEFFLDAVASMFFSTQLFGAVVAAVIFDRRSDVGADRLS